MYFRELCAEAAEHVLDDMVWSNAKNLVPNFSWQMPVSEVPREAHKLVWIFVPNFDNMLGSSLNHQPSPIFKLQTISVSHGNGFRKVQENIFACVSSQANAAAVAGIEIESESAYGVFLRPMTSGAMNRSVLHLLSSVEKIALRQGQYFCGFASEQAPVGSHFICFRIDLHAGRGVVEHHGALTDLACVDDGEQLFRQPE